MDDSFLQSKLLFDDILENYKQGALKLKRELKSVDFADHQWRLQTYDQHGVAVVKVHCRECNWEIGGTSSDHS